MLVKSSRLRFSKIDPEKIAKFEKLEKQAQLEKQKETGRKQGKPEGVGEPEEVGEIKGSEIKGSEKNVAKIQGRDEITNEEALSRLEQHITQGVDSGLPKWSQGLSNRRQ